MNIRILLAVAGTLLLGACTPSEDSTLTSQEQNAAPDNLTTESNQGPAAVNSERLIAADSEPEQWMSYGRTYSQQHFSPLTEINQDNVDELGLAWYADFNIARGQESTPLVVDGVIYVTTAWSNVRAFDAVTGEPLWEFDSEVARDWGVRACCDVVNRGAALWNGKVFVGTIDGRMIAIDAATGETLWIYRMDEGQRGENAPRKGAGRGVAYWNDGGLERIYSITPGYQLVALDAASGNPIEEFGNYGVVDLKLGLDQKVDLINDPIGASSPPIVVNGVVIVGSAFPGGRAPAKKSMVTGHVRGFDARTGERLWIFHTIPHPGEFGHDTWEDEGWKLTGNTEIGRAHV